MLSILIPAYNEEKRIGKTLEKISSYLKKSGHKNFEMIVIDDGSKDNTTKVARSYSKKFKNLRVIQILENKGKGHAIKTGMLNAEYDTVLFTDSDLSTPIEELGKFMKEIKHYDIVIASRWMKGSNVPVPQGTLRKIFSRGFNLLVRVLLGLNFKDTQCGFKMFKNCKKLFEKQRLYGFGFDIEILFLAKKARKSIKELPVTWINDRASKVKPIRDVLYMFLDILTVRWNWMVRKYR